MSGKKRVSGASKRSEKKRGRKPKVVPNERKRDNEPVREPPAESASNGSGDEFVYEQSTTTAIVCGEPVFVPTSTQLATTTTYSATFTRPIMTTSISGGPTSVDHTGLPVAPSAQIIVDSRLQASLPKDADSARLVQGLQSTQETLPTAASAAEQPTPQPTAKTCEWRTPAPHWDEIQQASTSSQTTTEDEAASVTVSPAYAKVLQGLQARMQSRTKSTITSRNSNARLPTRSEFEAEHVPTPTSGETFRQAPAAEKRGAATLSSARREVRESVLSESDRDSQATTVRRSRGRTAKTQPARTAERTTKPRDSSAESEWSLVEGRNRRRRKGARKVPTLLSSSESEEEKVRPKKRGDRRQREDDASTWRSASSWERERASPRAQAQAVKNLKSWGLKFSGEDRGEDPEEFLEQLEDCREGAGVTDGELLRALPCVLSKRASRWYRTVRAGLTTWQQLRRAFRRQFIGVYDREDLLDDLKKRTQGKGEKIAGFLSNFRYIISRFYRPPSERRQVETAYRNLLPEYRRAMSEKLIESLDDLERYGRLWERQKDLDSRYTPPPPPEKMRVPGAAFLGAADKHKVAATKDEESVAATTNAAAPKERAASQKSQRSKVKARSQASQTEPPATGIADVVIVSSCATASAEPAQPEAEVRTCAVVADGGNFGRPPPQGQMRPYFGNYDGRERDNRSWSGPNRFSRTRDAFGTGWSSRGYERATGAGVCRSWRENKARGEFHGACFTCHAVGHRASQCPQITCFWCRKKGHVIRACPDRALKPRESCQVCCTPNVTFSNCPKCAALRESLRNGRDAGQGRRDTIRG